MSISCRRTVRALAVAAACAVFAAPSADAATGANARAAASGARCANADTPPGRLAVAATQASTLCLINAERTARALRSLRAQPALAKAASSFAAQMADERFFDHTSPSGSTLLSRIKATSYLRGAAEWSIAENIAWGKGELSTPRATVQAWMKSRPHRKNLLLPEFVEIGIGIASGGGPADVNPDRVGATYVANFGKRILRVHSAKRNR